MSRDQIREVWLEYEHLAEGSDDEENDFCNVAATLEDGRRYAFNVWTYRFLATAESECRASGEHLAGLYLPAPDLFVRNLKRQTIERALADWLDRQGRFPDHLECDLDDL